jgi:PilZ domain
MGMISMQHSAEKRRFARAPIDLPVEFMARQDRLVGGCGVGKDIAIGGMFIETAEHAPFGAHLLVSFHVPGLQDVLLVPGVVRWTNPTGMGVQFGLLGARETHVITVLMRSRSGVHKVV